MKSLEEREKGVKWRWNKCEELGEYLKKEEKTGVKLGSMGKMLNWASGGC
ncbi:MAG: hypothetical protein ACYTE5_08145 [Planctomycetota bacterium]|jgi:hypothetical protein